MYLKLITTAETIIIIPRRLDKRYKNINLFPFHNIMIFIKDLFHHYFKGYPNYLGPTYSYMFAIDMKPFSTLVLKLLHLSNCYYHQDLY